ncbi:hypothetical protein DFH09DRAFT_1490064 [Mycena vulgaris]|nr:hypothetical protein DFH09DRAFT_1490064 [Mycena vulgaris]
MPATQSSSESRSYPTSTSKILLFSGLVLCVVAAFICVRRRQAQMQAAQTRHARAPRVAHKRPSFHDLHLSAGAEAGAYEWRSIQPLAVQTPLQQPPKYAGSQWPSIKSRPDIVSSPSFTTDASLHTPTLLDDFAIIPADASDRHLHIAVLITMPLPPGPVASSDLAADFNITVGVVQTQVPAL